MSAQRLVSDALSRVGKKVGSRPAEFRSCARPAGSVVDLEQGVKPYSSGRISGSGCQQPPDPDALSRWAYVKPLEVLYVGEDRAQCHVQMHALRSCRSYHPALAACVLHRELQDTDSVKTALAENTAASAQAWWVVFSDLARARECLEHPELDEPLDLAEVWKAKLFGCRYPVRQAGQPAQTTPIPPRGPPTSDSLPGTE
jgi:hypothetical protein